MSEPTAWAYLDERRTHEVRVSIERGRTLDLVITESLAGGSPPEEQLRHRLAIVDAWDRKLHTIALEMRLCFLGTYHRSGTMGWVPVRLAQHAAPPDLTPLDLGERRQAIEVHHFTGEKERVVTLVGIHQDTPRGRRSILVRVDYRFPEATLGRMDVIHACLPPLLYRSALVAQHMKLSDERYRKAPVDMRQLVDPRVWHRLQWAIDDILQRLYETCADAPDLLRDASGRPVDARALELIAEASRVSRGAASREREYSLDHEFDLAATSVEGKKPDVLIDDLDPDVFTALQDPDVLAVYQRFVDAPMEADLFVRGERAILAAMRELREKVRPDERHLVSVVEASLLLRYALAKRIPVDPNVIKRVQHARAYL